MWRIKHRQKTSRSGDGSDVARRITEWYKLIKSVTAHNKGGCWLCRTWLCRATMVAFDGCFGHDFPEHRADHTPAASVTSPATVAAQRLSSHRSTTHLHATHTRHCPQELQRNWYNRDGCNHNTHQEESWVTWLQLPFTIEDTRDFGSSQRKIKGFSWHISEDLTMETLYIHYNSCIHSHKYWIDVMASDLKRYLLEWKSGM